MAAIALPRTIARLASLSGALLLVGTPAAAFFSSAYTGCDTCVTSPLVIACGTMLFPLAVPLAIAGATCGVKLLALLRGRGTSKRSTHIACVAIVLLALAELTLPHVRVRPGFLSSDGAILVPCPHSNSTRAQLNVGSLRIAVFPDRRGCALSLAGPADTLREAPDARAITVSPLRPTLVGIGEPWMSWSAGEALRAVVPGAPVVLFAVTTTEWRTLRDVAPVRTTAAILGFVVALGAVLRIEWSRRRERTIAGGRPATLACNGTLRFDDGVPPVQTNAVAARDQRVVVTALAVRQGAVYREWTTRAEARWIVGELDSLLMRERERNAVSLLVALAIVAITQSALWPAMLSSG